MFPNYHVWKHLSCIQWMQLKTNQAKISPKKFGCFFTHLYSTSLYRLFNRVKNRHFVFCFNIEKNPLFRFNLKKIQLCTNKYFIYHPLHFYVGSCFSQASVTSDLEKNQTTTKTHVNSSNYKNPTQLTQDRLVMVKVLI